MGRTQLHAGDRIYWEITDSQGRKFYGIGYIDENAAFPWLEDFASRLSKPVRIDIKKLEAASTVHFLEPDASEPLPTQRVGKSN